MPSAQTQRALELVGKLLDNAEAGGEWVSMQAAAAELGLNVEEHQVEPDAFGELGQTLYSFWDRDNDEDPLFLVWTTADELPPRARFFVIA